MNLETLIQFTQFGLVFPLAANSKKPMRGWKWQTMCTDDLEIMHEWLNQYPDANWALVPTRAVVVDVDVKNDKNGRQSIIDAGGLPETFEVSTPSGGSHYYYAGTTRTANGVLDGVDIRSGNDGYVVLPYSVTSDGMYTIVQNLNEIQWSSPAVCLPDLPSWLCEVLHSKNTLSTNCTCTQNATPLELSRHYTQIKNRIRYLFFRRVENRKLFHCEATYTDKSDSTYQYRIAKSMYCIGATDNEVLAMIKWWSRRNHRKVDMTRFLERIMPSAKADAQPYIQEWQAKQPARRKHGTTTDQIMSAILSGAKTPKAISDATKIKHTTVRSHLSRMVKAGGLIKTDAEYAIAAPRLAQDALAEAA